MSSSRSFLFVFVGLGSRVSLCTYVVAPSVHRPSSVIGNRLSLAIVSLVFLLYYCAFGHRAARRNVFSV